MRKHFYNLEQWWNSFILNIRKFYQIIIIVLFEIVTHTSLFTFCMQYPFIKSFQTTSV